jgi:hypothetical protein
VLLNADFPRLKKNQLSKEQQKKNDHWLTNTIRRGSFPYTLLLDAEGKIIHTWEGAPGETTNEFISNLKNMMNANN